MEKNRFDSNIRLLGKATSDKLAHSHVMIVGLGGVGSWCAEALVRSGVGEISIVDLDDICISNTNRQLQAIDGNYGKFKVHVLAERFKLINPDIKIHAIEDFLTENNINSILNKAKVDYVVDAIDSLKSKCSLASYCRDKKLPLIVTGGAGGKTDISKIQKADLNRSYNDKLLMRMKKVLKKDYGFTKFKHKKFNITCIFSPEDIKLPEDVCDARGTNCQNGMGSAVHITATFGLWACDHVISELISD